MNASEPAQAVAFADLGLSEQVLAAVAAIGYESASPIQAATIPALLEGADVLGQAQTGTGKTAAFALPILSRIDLSKKAPQALVLVPTRELAIQVAEACQKYGSHLSGLHVLPIYGGQSYTPQLNALRRGVHVIVATPGRVMDHLERGTLSLKTIAHVVLDAFGVDPGGLFRDAQRQQEGFDDLVLPPAVLGHFPAFAGEEDGAVGFLGDEAGVLQALQGLDHGGIGHAQPHGRPDVHDRFKNGAPGHHQIGAFVANAVEAAAFIRAHRGKVP